uniref:Uncharacterized protein n=1 Tax=Acrobeloides nanus TaxID=290746 RepID=A0A914E2J9_9BILA
MTGKWTITALFGRLLMPTKLRDRQKNAQSIAQMTRTFWRLSYTNTIDIKYPEDRSKLRSKYGFKKLRPSVILPLIF